MITDVFLRIDYIISCILFCIGLYAITVKGNLIKKLIGLNIVETSVYLFFIALSDVRLGTDTSQWASASFIKDPVAVSKGTEVMVNAIPSALILTAIVVSVSVTAVALSIVVKLHRHYGTIETDEITALKG